MGRVSVADQLKNSVGVDYDALLKKLVDDNFNPDGISDFLSTKYQIHVKPPTVKLHLKQYGIENNSNKKSPKYLLEDMGVNYMSLILSLSHLSKEEISEEIYNRYKIKVQPANIYQYAQKNGIKIKSSPRKKRDKDSFDISNIIITESHNDSNLLIENLPTPPRKFHPTKLSGFTIFKETDMIVEILGSLKIESRVSAQIELWIKVYKDSLISETNPIFKIKVPYSILKMMTPSNYAKVCRQISYKEIGKLESMNMFTLRSNLIAHCKNLKEMESLLAKCHIKKGQ